MFQDGYRIPEMDVILRVEGLAKGLIRKFKTMDPQTWKTSDLANILFNEMGIKERYTVCLRQVDGLQQNALSLLTPCFWYSFSGSFTCWPAFCSPSTAYFKGSNWLLKKINQPKKVEKAKQSQGCQVKEQKN